MISDVIRVEEEMPLKCHSVVAGSDQNHSTIALCWTSGSEPETYCGQSWCQGECGYPALVISGCQGPYGSRYDLRAYCFKDKVEQLMQSFRVPWTGIRRESPAEFQTDLMKRFWWG